MVVEIIAVGALAIGAYNFVTNSTFRSKVESDFSLLEKKVPGFISTVKSAVTTAVSTIETDLKKL